MSRFKCHVCYLILQEADLIDDKCPVCNNQVKPMCPRDNNTCSHQIIEKIAYCPDCGEAMCPVCGCHDVIQISRVTGYLQEVGGWNAGKQAELKDRHRVTI